jgi:peptide/nickel transport system ATP-binding protein
MIEAIRIKKTFLIQGGFLKQKKKLYAINGISFNVSSGETIGIVGESGCGKSTLAEILLGLQEPTVGEVRIKSKPIKKYNKSELASIIQPVFQDPYSSLNPRKTIYTIISLPLRVNKKNNKIKDVVNEICSLVGLPLKFMKRLPHQLSGGQRQRVAIARALVLKPEIIIFDEPTSALDVSVQAQILNLLKKLQKELKLTYILISHDLSVVEHMVDKVIVVYLGRIVEVASTNNLFNNPIHPYTQALLSSVMTPEPGKGIPDTGIGLYFPNPTELPSGCSFHQRCPIANKQCRLDIPILRHSKNSFVACHYA